LHLDRPIHFSQISGHETLHGVVATALLLFDDFPRNYLKFLDRTIYGGQYLRSKNQHKYFSWFHPDFYRTIPPSFAALLYKAFNENINKILRASGQAPIEILVNTERRLDNIIEQFGFDHSHFFRFLKDGIFRHSEGHRFDAHLFLKTMIELRSVKKTESCSETEHHINYQEIVRLFSKDEERVYYFLRSVIQGEIPHCFEDFRLAGINRFFFDGKDLDGF
jgi:hypothetical protein